MIDVCIVHLQKALIYFLCTPIMMVNKWTFADVYINETVHIVASKWTSSEETFSFIAAQRPNMSDVEVVGEVGQKGSRSKALEHKA